MASNNKVGTVAVSVDAESASPPGQQPSVVANFYTDPSNPNIYVSQTITVGSGYVATGAGWKVVILATFPSNGKGSTGTLSLDWAVSASAPQ